MEAIISSQYYFILTFTNVYLLDILYFLGMFKKGNYDLHGYNPRSLNKSIVTTLTSRTDEEMFELNFIFPLFLRHSRAILYINKNDFYQAETVL